MKNLSATPAKKVLVSQKGMLWWGKSGGGGGGGEVWGTVLIYRLCEGQLQA